MAELRERGTSFLQSSDNVLKAPAVDCAMGTSTGPAIVATISSIADDFFKRIGNGIDFSKFVLRVTPTNAPVPSLTDRSCWGPTHAMKRDRQRDGVKHSSQSWS